MGAYAKLHNLDICRKLLLFVLLGLRAWGQQIAGAIVGHVVDSTGVAVVRTIRSDEDGSYIASFLPLGRYAVEVEAPGFKRYTQSGIELYLSQKLTVSLRHEVGDLAQ